jgi:hypothetical protein
MGGVLDPLMRRISTPLTSWDVLVEVVSAGLLVEREQLRYSFAHLTFQEYLAAVHIRDHSSAATLAWHVDDTWWRETTRLYSTLVNGDQVVAACLESNSTNALALAFDCIQDDADLDSELRDRTLDLLDRAQRDDCPDDIRTLVTKVLATRLLRDSTMLQSGSTLCRAPVPNRLLQLWQRAERIGSLVPWNDEPATEIPLPDAKVFSTWLAAVAEDPGIRLPVPGELGEHVVVPSGHFAWPSAGLHVPDGKHPHHISQQALLDQLALDLDPEVKRVIALLRARIEAKAMQDREEAAGYQRWMKPFLAQAQLHPPDLHMDVSVMAEEIVADADAALQGTSLAVRELFGWQENTANFSHRAGPVIRLVYRYAHGNPEQDVDLLRSELAWDWPDEPVDWDEPKALVTAAHAVTRRRQVLDSWDRLMKERLLDACRRIADGARQGDEAFRRARLIALFLAAESRVKGRFLRIAALATLIERKQAGVVPADGVIVLVRDVGMSPDDTLRRQERVPIPRPAVQQQFQAALDSVDPNIVHGKLDKAISRAPDVCQAWKNCPDQPFRHAEVAARFSSPNRSNGWDATTVAAIAAAIERYIQPDRQA